MGGSPDRFVGFDFGGRHHFFTQDGERPREITMDDYRALERQLADLEAKVKKREEAAYEHGLGDRAKVYRENKILGATIAALTNPSHELNL